MYKKISICVISIITSFILLFGCSANVVNNTTQQSTFVSNTVSTTNSQNSTKNNITSSTTTEQTFDISSIPEYNGSPYVEINDNVPQFTKSEITTSSFEIYGGLDGLGRCTTAFSCIGKDLMPTEKRGEIGSVKPTGWHLAKYDFIDGKYLYNRCHLIGYQLTGENANEKNLITGTRYLNIQGMLPFENEVAEYIKNTNNHVMYRVTPIFEEDNLLADGVQMEGYSVEDKGRSISFNVFCYNVQPGVNIDYATGDNSTSGEYTTTTDEDITDTYIVNLNTKKFHKPSCSSISQMSKKNKKQYKGKRSSLINNGYEPCKNCNP